MSRRQKSQSQGVRSKIEAIDSNVRDFNVYENHPLQKSSTNMSSSLLTQRSRNMMDEADWDQKELDDFDEDEQLDDRVSSLVLKTATKPFGNSHYSTAVKRQNDGKHYPSDLWYWISKYIAPEDVLRFALICRMTNSIVNSTAFWINLLKKHKPMVNFAIFRALRNEHCSAVRTYVVRSLHQSYPLFLSRAKKIDMINQDPYFLRGWLCTRIWYSTGTTPSDAYCYFFEFRSDSTPINTFHFQSALLKNENEYQIDEKTCLLKVVSSRFASMEPVMGLFLCEIKQAMTSDFFNMRLKMNFNSSKFNVKRTNIANNHSITIEPVLSLKLYRWYDCPVQFE